MRIREKTSARLRHVRRFIRSMTLLGCLGFASSATAVSPAEITDGHQLFERKWTTRNPALGNDGLGPLFNGRSCAACHHQGSVGGAGDAQFNSKLLGIEELQITGGNVTPDVIKRMIGGFHPGFVSPAGVLRHTFDLSHHGGSPGFSQARQALMQQVPAVFSKHGGALNASEVRYANATPILYTANSVANKVMIRARLFQRNTTALFGAGLIDQVSGKQLQAIAKAQTRNREISGRVATLPNGLYGRFGWRGNSSSLLDFCDHACAADVGLETKRKRQPIDPMLVAYRNPSIDISDDQIKKIAAFIAALPAPARELPVDSLDRAMATRGEMLFTSIGCAICHVPDLSPAVGMYSDLLLHDMGLESMDLRSAAPYIVDASLVNTVSSKLIGSTKEITRSTYAGDSSIRFNNPFARSRTPRPRLQKARRSYHFVAPSVPSPLKRYVDLVDSKSKLMKSKELTYEVVATCFAERHHTTETRRLTQNTYVQIFIEPTNFNQEWRTPPLWGVRDSAPYMHDGRAETLLEAITIHSGEAQGTRERFLNLPLPDRQAIIAFLKTLVAPKLVTQPGV